jgi:hypothetical protein
VFRLNAGLKYMASNLLAGKMVAGPLGVWDERELQRLIVDQYPAQRDVIVMGSSRVMMVRKRFLKGNVDFFNHSVAGAGINDFISIMGLYKQKKILPRTVVLGIDPWAFNKNNGLGQPWEILAAYYHEMLTEMGSDRAERVIQGKKGTDRAPSTGRLSKLKQLINLDYTLQNWDCLRRGKKLRITDTIAIDNYVREPDGSLHFPYALRHANMTKDGPANDMPGGFFKDFELLYGTDVFEDLVRYLRKKSVKVVFLLPPFHPHAYRSCFTNPTYGITLKIEEYLTEFAGRNGVTVVGSYNPAMYGFRGEDFCDGWHSHDTVMQRLFEGYP